MPAAAPLVLRPGDEDRLRSLAQSARAAHAQRARILLLAAEGVSHAGVAREVGVSTPTVLAWRERYEAGGVGALVDLPRAGRPPAVDEVAIVARTVSEDGRPPRHLGVPHWSARLLAEQLSHEGVSASFATISRVWRKWGLQPQNSGMLAIPTQPPLPARVRDVVGLYLAQGFGAVVVSVDGGPSARLPGRSVAVPPPLSREAVPPTQGDHRPDVASLFAVLEAAFDQVNEPAGEIRHPKAGFLPFLHHVARADPRSQLHIVGDAGVRADSAVARWLAAHRRFVMHADPPGCSWLNLVKVVAELVARRAVPRGTQTSVPDLTAALGTFLAADDARGRAMQWVRTTDRTLIRADRKRTSDTEHWTRGSALVDTGDSSRGSTRHWTRRRQYGPDGPR